MQPRSPFSLPMARRRWIALGAAAAILPRGLAAQGTPLMAIDILLEPDQPMLERAAADNARLRANYPDGFALDSAHTPHVTMLQLLVEAADLPRIQNATAGVLAAASPKDWRLTAAGRYYFPTDGLGLAGITIRPTPELLALQAALIAAMAPFTRRGDTAGAFEAATLGGAAALGREDIGALGPGMAADIVLVDLNHPLMQPARDPLRSFVFHAADRAVRTVLVDGEIVLKEGAPVHLDPAAAMERVAEAQARMLRDSVKIDYANRPGDEISPLSLPMA